MSEISNDFFNEMKFEAVIFSRIKLLYLMLNQPPPAIFLILDIPLSLIPLFLEFLIHKIVFFFGFVLSIIGVLINWNKPKIMAIYIIPLYIIILFPFILGNAEYRMMYLAYPFMMLACLQPLYDISYFKNYRKFFKCIYCISLLLLVIVAIIKF